MSDNNAMREYRDDLRAQLAAMTAERDRYRAAAELLWFELRNTAESIYTNVPDVRRALDVTAWIDAMSTATDSKETK